MENAPETAKPKKSLAGHLKTLAPLIIRLGGLGFGLSQGWQQYLTLDSISQNIVGLDEQISENFWLVFGVYLVIYDA